MSWFSDTLDTIKATTGHEPIECPRGWGQVSFVGSVWFIPPMAGASRTCPIGGVEQCEECKYATNPDAFRLSDQLGELNRLRAAGELSEEEYASRRQAVVRLHVPEDGRVQHMVAWIMGPLGVLLASGGTLLAINVHPGFWGLTAVGGVSVVLSLSLWMLSRSSWPPSGSAARG